MSTNEPKYVFRHYGHLMTTNEERAYRHLAGTLKATLGRSDATAQAEVKSGTTHFRKLLSDDPNVLDLAQEMEEWQPATVDDVREIVHRDLAACDAEQTATFKKILGRALFGIHRPLWTERKCSDRRP